MLNVLCVRCPLGFLFFILIIILLPKLIFNKKIALDAMFVLYGAPDRSRTYAKHALGVLCEPW